MGMGIGDWGLGIGDWAQSPIPIPNPQSPIPIIIKSKLFFKYNHYFTLNKIMKIIILKNG